MAKDSKVFKKVISEIKDSISRVNLTLKHYEENYVSASRTGEISQKEFCKSLADFIEIRFNRECYNIPELKEAVELTKGHLFVCRELLGADSMARRFDSALLTLITEDDIETEVNKIIAIDCDDVENFRRFYPEIVNGLRNDIYLAIEKANVVLSKCQNFRFNSVKKKIRLTDDSGKVLK